MYGKDHPFIKTVYSFKYFRLELLSAKQKKKNNNQLNAHVFSE